MKQTQQALLELLQAVRPGSLLCVAAALPAALDPWLAGDDDRRLHSLAPGAALAELAGCGRYDYALVVGALESLSLDEGSALIARLRDVHCHRFAVVYSDIATEGRWTHGRFLALTLMRHCRLESAAGVTSSIYTYDIDGYNRPRAWNSPRGWANPKNFKRFRW